MKIPICPSKLFSIIMFEKLFYLKFFYNYFENLLFLDNLNIYIYIL